MKSVHKIEQQEWMRWPETIQVMDALSQEERPPQALFVGGCVRNVLLNEAVTDIDIATLWQPEEIVKHLEKRGIKVVPTGLDHGTVTAVVNGKPFEITTLRKDVETDGRRAVVAFSKDWKEDAARRDFTMNTLLMNLEGEVFDPLESGVKDLQERRVVFVGDPAERIAEDYLRILRFFRFHAWYGKGAMDEVALKACAAASNKIGMLPKERITHEFLKLLKASSPVSALRAMFAAGVLSALAPAEGKSSFAALSSLCERQEEAVDDMALAARIFVLMGCCNHVNKYEEFIIFSNTLKGKIKVLNDVLGSSSLGTEREIKVTMYRHGREETRQALLVLAACGDIAKKAEKEALDLIENWDIPVFPVSGEDLIAEGYEQGPELGQKLKQLEQEWVDRGFS